MILTNCSNCGARLQIDENDMYEGCRERENAYCPRCNEIATTIYTSGIPSVKVIG